MYENGRGVRTDESKAIKLYHEAMKQGRKAADQGDAVAQ